MQRTPLLNSMAMTGKVACLRCEKIALQLLGLPVVVLEAEVGSCPVEEASQAGAALAMVEEEVRMEGAVEDSEVDTAARLL